MTALKSKSPADVTSILAKEQYILREARRDGRGLEFLGVADYKKANVWEPRGRRA